MIVCEAEQGTDQWYIDRMGIPTASEYAKILTSTGKASTSAAGYMNQLLADWLAGKPVDRWGGNDATATGHDREAEARDMYSFISGNDVKEIGLCLRDDRMTGCSVDGLVGDDGINEIKNPKAATLISYKLANKLPSKYVHKVQGQLWIKEREWCDFISYSPMIADKPIFIIRTGRDEKMISELSAGAERFIEDLMKIVERVRG